MTCKNDYVCDLLHRTGLSEVASRTAANLVVRGLRILVVVLVALVVSRIAARIVRRSVSAVMNAPTTGPSDRLYGYWMVAWTTSVTRFPPGRQELELMRGD